MNVKRQAPPTLLITIFTTIIIAFCLELHSQQTLQKYLVGNWISSKKHDSVSLDILDSANLFFGSKDESGQWIKKRCTYKIDKIKGESVIKIQIVDISEPLYLSLRKKNINEFKAKIYDPDDKVIVNKWIVIDNGTATLIFKRINKKKK